MYREHLLLYDVFFIVKSKQVGGGGIEMRILERTHFLNDPLIYFYLYFCVHNLFFYFQSINFVTNFVKIFGFSEVFCFLFPKKLYPWSLRV